MYLTRINNCRLCGGQSFWKVLDLKSQTIQGAFISPNQKITPSKRSIENTLLLCNPSKGGCGLLQMEYSINPDILYSSYFYRSGISSTMKNHLKFVVDQAMSFLNEYDSPVVMDCACNDLTLLNYFPSSFKKYGIDPSDITKEAAKSNPSITVFNQCFPDQQITHSLKGRIDFWSGLAFFYDIENPVAFCQAINEILAEKGVGVIEVAYLPAVFKNLCYDGFVNEHIVLYSLQTLEFVLNKAGLKIFKAEENDINGGSLQVWFCKDNCHLYDKDEYRNQLLQLKINEFDLCLDDINVYYDFRDKVHNHAKELHKLLLNYKRDGKIIHAYGMSTKLNCLLQFCDIGNEIISAAAERDSRKINGQTLSGIPIISEEESKRNADIYLVGPYHFKKEILKREKEAVKNGKIFIFPLPEILVIDQYNLDKHLDTK